MTTSFSYGRRGRLYRYYIAGSLDPSRTDASPPAKRVPAGPLERLVLQSITRLLMRPIAWPEALRFISAVELWERSIQLVLETDTALEPHEPHKSAVDRLRAAVAPDRIVADGGRLRLIIDRQPVFRGGKQLGSADPSESASSETRVLLRSAHRLLQAHSMSPLEPATHVNASAPSWQRQRRIMVIGLLAPGLQKAMAQGSYTKSPESLFSRPMPLAWVDQQSQQ